MSALRLKTIPIRKQVYLGLALLCMATVLIFGSTTWHIFYSHNRLARLTENYYETSNFISAYLKSEAALESIVDTIDQTDVSVQQSASRQSIQQMYQYLEAVRDSPDISNSQCNVLGRAMYATLGTYEKYAEQFFTLWDNQNQKDAYSLYYNTLRKCGGYLQQYCSELLEEELYLGQDVSQQINHENMRFTLIHMCICTLIVLLSILFYRTIGMILRPIYTMIDVSNQITDGNLNPPDVNYTKQDEIGTLVSSFNQMKNATAKLIVTLQEKKQAEALLAEARARKAEQEKELQEAVVRQLRSQITPHFLFNTLNIIARTARVENAAETERLIYALSHLFRSSLRSTVEYEIPLFEEIQMVKDYIAIQQARFGDRIQLDFRMGDNVDPDDIMVPSFILQPLVENSILHGLEGKVAGGRIRVRITRDQMRLFITVCDNGTGMSKERLEALLQNDLESERRFTGIGIKNVRIRVLMAHPENTFEFLSKENLGTSVKILLNLSVSEGTSCRKLKS